MSLSKLDRISSVAWYQVPAIHHSLGAYDLTGILRYVISRLYTSQIKRVVDRNVLTFTLESVLNFKAKTFPTYLNRIFLQSHSLITTPVLIIDAEGVWIIMT